MGMLGLFMYPRSLGWHDLVFHDGEVHANWNRIHGQRVAGRGQTAGATSQDTATSAHVTMVGGHCSPRRLRARATLNDT